MFIFKAMHTVSLHNSRAGGTTRLRLLLFTEKALVAASKQKNWLQAMLLRFLVYFKIFLFENLYWLYRKIFGVLEVRLGADGKVE